MKIKKQNKIFKINKETTLSRLEYLTCFWMSTAMFLTSFRDLSRGTNLRNLSSILPLTCKHETFLYHKLNLQDTKMFNVDRSSLKKHLTFQGNENVSVLTELTLKYIFKKHFQLNQIKYFYVLDSKCPVLTWG